MYRPTQSRLLVILTSDCNLKAQRFITSLVNSLIESANQTKWQITILRPQPHSGSALALPANTLSQLDSLNVSFLQPQIFLSPSVPFQEFLFCTHNGSYSIAAQRNRGLLAANDFLQISGADLIAVLDDDLLFQNAVLSSDRQGDLCVRFETTFDYISGLATIHSLSRSGPLIGGSTGCPPVPGVTAIKCAIDDITNSANSLCAAELCAAQDSDYYYDFRVQSDSDVQRGAWLSYYYNDENFAPSFDNILSGVTPTRPLLFNPEKLFVGDTPSTRRGGNTYFSDAQQLLPIPHLALSVDGLSTRRSDMVVAEIARQRGIVYQETYFPLGHLRLPNKSASTRAGVLNAIEAELFGVAFHRGVKSFLSGGDHVKAWKQIFTTRLTRVLQTPSYVERAPLPSHVRSEVMELAHRLDCKGFLRRVVRHEKEFFQNYLQLIEHYSEIHHCWITLIEGHKYEVGY